MSLYRAQNKVPGIQNIQILGVGLMQLVIKILLNWHIRLSQKAPIVGHVTNSVWSPSYDIFFLEIAKIWTTPVSLVIPSNP